MIDVPMVCDSFIEPLKSSRGDTPKITLRCAKSFSKYRGIKNPPHPHRFLHVGGFWGGLGF